MIEYTEVIHSTDIVVSFETLEHFYEHDLFMQEIKRVLRPGGILIISTPNSDIYSAIGIPANPYHIHELTKSEFTFLCKKYFKYMSTLAQRSMAGSVLVQDDDITSGTLLFESRDKEYVEYSQGLSRAPYLISILSDENNIKTENNIYISEGIESLLNANSQYFQQILLEKNTLTGNLEHALQEKSQHMQDILNKNNSKWFYKLKLKLNKITINKKNIPQLE